MLSKNTLFQLAFAVGERFGADLGWNRPLSEEYWLRSCSMTRHPHSQNRQTRSSCQDRGIDGSAGVKPGVL